MVSFREYISLGFEKLTLDELLENHAKENKKIILKIKPFQYWNKYLKNRYYPFYREQPDLYPMRLGEVVNMILEIELPLLRNVELAYIHKIKHLLSVIAESVPFTLNVSKLSDKIGINRITFLSYIHYLDEIGLTRNLFKEANGISKLQKPAKVYLENTNLAYLLAKENTNKGNLCETFFANQVGYHNALLYTEQGDFLVNDKYTFEVGGKTKSNEQIQDIYNSFIVSDDIEYDLNNKIPLWLFGFLY